jgi:hypothetical protein
MARSKTNRFERNCRIASDHPYSMVVTDSNGIQAEYFPSPDWAKGYAFGFNQNTWAHGCNAYLLSELIENATDGTLAVDVEQGGIIRRRA